MVQSSSFGQAVEGRLRRRDWRLPGTNTVKSTFPEKLTGRVLRDVKGQHIELYRKGDDVTTSANKGTRQCQVP